MAERPVETGKPRGAGLAEAGRRRGIGLRAKLTIPLVIAIAVLALLFGGLSTILLRNQVHDGLRLQARQAVMALTKAAGQGAMFDHPDTLRRLCTETLAIPNVAAVGIFSAAGQPVAVVGDSGLRPVLVPEQGELTDDVRIAGSLGDPHIQAGALILRPEDADTRTPTYAVFGNALVEDQPVVGTAVVAMSTSAATELLATWSRTVLLLTSVVLAVGLLASTVIVRLTLRPLRRLYRATRTIAKGSLEIELPSASADEIGVLTQSFNSMVRELKRSRDEIAGYNRDLEHAVDQRTAELKQTQERLVQTEKLGALGQLVAGVAHDLNNPLAGILGYAQLLQRNGRQPKRKQWLQGIESEVQRGRKIVRNLLLFAQQREPELGPVDVNDLVRRTIDTLTNATLDGVEICVDLDNDLPPALADPDQLQEVLVNLITNAVQAIQEQEGAQRVAVTSEVVRGTIRVHVDDNGPGIPPAVRNKILEPFFTTKPMGKGTGLGLSICYGILKRHRGDLEIGSAPLGGARFTLRLTLAEIRLTTEASEDEQTGRPAPAGGQGEAILILEDEKPISEIIETILSSHNYKVDTASSLSEARARLQSQAYDMIVSDFQLPDGDVRALHRDLEETSPALLNRFVLVTGDTVSPITRDFLETTNCPYLLKPFEMDELLAFVADSIARGR